MISVGIVGWRGMVGSVPDGPYDDGKRFFRF